VLGGGETRSMQSRLLHDALKDFAEQASKALQAELAAGAEIPFELAAGPTGRAGRAELQLYSPMTGRFIAERWDLLLRLPGHDQAVKALEAFRGLDRYLASLELRSGLRSPIRSALASQVLKAFTEDVFEEQSDFALRQGRLLGALARLDAAAAAQSGSLTLVASLHGLAILSPQVQLAERLIVARPETLSGVPEQAMWPLLPDGGSASGKAGAPDHLLVVLDVPEQDDRIDRALDYGRDLLRGLLRALRLYGDGRIALGPLAWVCAGDGPFAPVALGLGGRPHGVLVVRAEQEDELRAFCNLLARRTPREDSLAWALRRFELGCERESELEGLSDHLLALQALLEPERVAHGLLAARTAALCAPAESRKHAAARVLRALELERDAVRGDAVESTAAVELAREVAAHVRALLRDVICGHLQPDLIELASELMLAVEEPAVGAAPANAPVKAARAVPSRARKAASEEEQTRVIRARRRGKPEQAQEDSLRQGALPI
jgi:hypothetical protein